MLQKSKPYILVIPALTLVCVLFFGGLIEGAVQSLSVGPGSVFSFENYKELLIDEDIYISLGLSMKISIVVTMLSSSISMCIGYLLYVLVKNNKNRTSRLVKKIIKVPMLFPYIIAGYLFYLFFSQSGIISRMLFQIGIISDLSQFPVMTNDKFGIGIIMTYVWKTTPFIVLMILPGVEKIKSQWIDVGRVYGVSKIDFFKKVVVPIIKAPMIMAGYIVFSYTFLAVEVPMYLGVTYPKTLSIYAFDIYSKGVLSGRPKATALYILMVMIVVIIGVIILGIRKLGELYEK